MTSRTNGGIDLLRGPCVTWMKFERKIDIPIALPRPRDPLSVEFLDYQKELLQHLGHQTAAHAVGDRAVVAIDVGDEILRDEALPVARGDRARIHAALVQGERIGHDDDQLAEALGGGQLVRAFGKSGEAAVEGVVPSAVAMEQIHRRIAAGLIAGVARRQVDGDIAIGGIGLEIAFERLAVHGDVVDRPSARASCRPASAPSLGIQYGRRTGRESHHKRDRRRTVHDHLNLRPT